MRIKTILLASIMAAGTALAHDHDHPELTGWYKSLVNSNGSPCCDGSDALRIEDPDWQSVCDDKGCHYQVRLDGRWWDVPEYAVVKGPNKSGKALVWPIRYGFPDKPADYVIRCFMPGAEG